MSGLCGWFSTENAGVPDPLVLEAMGVQLSRFDKSIVRNASFALGAVAAAGDHSGVFQESDRLVAVWGRAHFADRDLAELARHRGAAQALSQGYERRGKDIFAALSGAFACAIMDGRRGEALLAIDRMGTRPLSYSIVSRTLVFGSTLDAISAFPGGSARIDRQAIYDYVYFHMVPGPRTMYSGRRRLLPGSFLVWNGREPE